MRHFTLWLLDDDFFPSLVIFIASAFFLGFIPSLTIKYLVHKMEVKNARTNNKQSRRR